MYKVLLADDEGIVIESITFIIEREFGGRCEVAAAKTGRGVIELAESFQPDIAIMDIQMPGINGIEAMKEIQTFNRNVIFIVMSAYDKFDYAKEAINLGVMEYLTKPMEKHKITATLKRAMALTDRQKERRRNELLVKEKMETVVPIIENGLIYSILLQEHFKEDIDNFTHLLGISKEYGYMAVLICGEAQEGNHMTNAVGTSVKLQSHYTQIREIVKEFFPGIVGSIMANKIAVFIPCDQIPMDYNARIALIEKARQLVRKLRQRVELSFRLGIGSIMELNQQIKSYQEALNSLVNTTGKVAHVGDLPLNCEYDPNYPLETEKKLFEYVASGHPEETGYYAEAYFQWMVETYADHITDIRLKVLEFVLWAEHLAYESGGMLYDFIGRTDYLAGLELKDMKELKQWFLDKMTQASRNVATKKQERATDVVEQAKTYIQANYVRDLGLEDVSRVVDISPYYFSRIFKEGTGVNFIDYVTQIRIEKAKRLLMDDGKNHSMKEICILIGYADPNYFSRSFKKNTGVTPTEYKEGKRI